MNTTTSFKNFLTEDVDLKEKCEIIKKKCSQFLKEAGQYPLYRGQHTYRFENDTHENRITKNTLTYVVTMFNVYMQDRIKIKHVRNRHAVFASGSFYDVEHYGSVNFMFPEDNYRYIWSQHNRDFMVPDKTNWNRFVDSLEEKIPEAEEVAEIIKNAFIKHPLITTKDALTKYSQDFKMSNGKNAFVIAKKCFGDVFDRYDYQTDYLRSAITSDHEIIFTTKKYYLISMTEIDNFFNLTSSGKSVAYVIRYQKLLELLK